MPRKLEYRLVLYHGSELEGDRRRDEERVFLALTDERAIGAAEYVADSEGWRKWRLLRGDRLIASAGGKL